MTFQIRVGCRLESRNGKLLVMRQILPRRTFPNRWSLPLASAVFARILMIKRQSCPSHKSGKTRRASRAFLIDSQRSIR